MGDPSQLFLAFWLFIFGSVFGSFLNVCIHRFPAHPYLRDQLRSLTSHSSGCPRCSSPIRWRDNIPILGWLMLLGKCRDCRRPISARYPLVEGLTGALFVLLFCVEIPGGLFFHASESGLYHEWGPQIIEGGYSTALWLSLRLALHLAMICGLVAASFIDLDVKLIPDGTTIPVMLTAIVASAVFGQLYIMPVWTQDPSVTATLRPVLPGWLSPLMFEWDVRPFLQSYPRIHGLLVSLAGFLVGGGTVWIVRIIGGWVLKQEAMGFGDVVLMAMAGAVIGWQPVLMAFFLAPMLAVLAALVNWLVRRDNVLPYGPWLSLATVGVLVFWKPLWPAAERIFDMGPVLPLIGLFMCVTLAACLYLIQIVKRLLGIETVDPFAPQEVWTSADHLSYYNSGRPDAQTGAWRTENGGWPGRHSGRGLGGYQQWKG